VIVLQISMFPGPRWNRRAAGIAGVNTPANAIVGFYLDANNKFHGFLRTPPED
jgi:hypothetical protein